MNEEELMYTKKILVLFVVLILMATPVVGETFSSFALKVATSWKVNEGKASIIPIVKIQSASQATLTLQEKAGVDGVVEAITVYIFDYDFDAEGTVLTSNIKPFKIKANESIELRTSIQVKSDQWVGVEVIVDGQKFYGMEQSGKVNSSSDEEEDVVDTSLAKPQDAVSAGEPIENDSEAGE